MQITINLPPDLEQDLIRQAAQSNIPLQTLILQALRQMTQISRVSTSRWPEVILSVLVQGDRLNTPYIRSDVIIQVMGLHRGAICAFQRQISRKRIFGH